MHRSIPRQLAILLSLTALGGCLIEVEGPAADLGPRHSVPAMVVEDEALDALLRDADARIAAAPTSPRVGESVLDHDHDHADCDHDHDHEDHR